MNTYLAIITTVLVLTQIIRVTQNHFQLRRQKILFKKQVGELAEMEVVKEDFDMQRKAYRLIVEKLERETLRINKMIEVGEIVRLKDGRKGEVRGELLSGEYLLASSKGGQISNFTIEDILEGEDE